MSPKTVFVIVEFIATTSAILLMYKWGFSFWQIVVIITLFSIDAVFYRHHKMLE